MGKEERRKGKLIKEVDRRKNEYFNGQRVNKEKQKTYTNTDEEKEGKG